MSGVAQNEIEGIARRSSKHVRWPFHRVSWGAWESAPQAGLYRRVPVPPEKRFLITYRFYTSYTLNDIAVILPIHLLYDGAPSIHL